MTRALVVWRMWKGGPHLCFERGWRTAWSAGARARRGFRPCGNSRGVHDLLIGFLFELRLFPFLGNIMNSLLASSFRPSHACKGAKLEFELSSKWLLRLGTCLSPSQRVELSQDKNTTTKSGKIGICSLFDCKIKLFSGRESAMERSVLHVGVSASWLPNACRFFYVASVLCSRFSAQGPSWLLEFDSQSFINISLYPLATKSVCEFYKGRPLLGSGV